MNREILRQLRRVAEDAPRELFRMRSLSEPTPCGTAMCLIGYARHDGWFLENTNIADWIAVDHDGTVMPTRLGLPARLAALLGVPKEDAIRLFLLDSGFLIGPNAVSKEEVIENIDRLLECEPARPYAVLVRRAGEVWRRRLDSAEVGAV